MHNIAFTFIHICSINISIKICQYLFIGLKYQILLSYRSSALFQGPKSLFQHLHRLNMGLVLALKYAASMMMLHDISTAPCAYCVYNTQLLSRRTSFCRRYSNYINLCYMQSLRSCGLSSQGSIFIKTSLYIKTLIMRAPTTTPTIK